MQCGVMLCSEYEGVSMRLLMSAGLVLSRSDLVSWECYHGKLCEDLYSTHNLQCSTKSAVLEFM